MNRQYQITLRDCHELNGEKDENINILFGTLDFSGQNFTLSYRENTGEYAGLTTTVEYMHPGTVVITRHGSNQTELTIEEGRRHTCFYQTAYGSLLMGIYGQEVASGMSLLGGSLYLHYTIDFNGAMASDNNLHITVKEIF